MTVGAAQKTVLKASGAVPGPRPSQPEPARSSTLRRTGAAVGAHRSAPSSTTRAPGALSRALGPAPAPGRAPLRRGIPEGPGLSSTIPPPRGIRHEKGVVALEAQGREAVEAVRFRRADGTGGRIETGLLLLHQGVIPMTQMSRALRLDHAWDPVRLAFHPMTDHFGRSSLPGVLVAGDGAGVEGAEAAALRGHLAALAVAESLGSIEAKTRDREARTPLKALARHRRLRPFLDVLYRPADGFRVPADDRTIVCRCEELSAGELRAAVRRGGRGPNQLKSFVRCGMGPLPGPALRSTVTSIVAAETAARPGRSGSYSHRRPTGRSPSGAAQRSTRLPRRRRRAGSKRHALALQGLKAGQSGLTGFPSLDASPPERSAASPKAVQYGAGQPENSPGRGGRRPWPSTDPDGRCSRTALLSIHRGHGQRPRSARPSHQHQGAARLLRRHGFDARGPLASSRAAQHADAPRLSLWGSTLAVLRPLQGARTCAPATPSICNDGLPCQSAPTSRTITTSVDPRLLGRKGALCFVANVRAITRTFGCGAVPGSDQPGGCETIFEDGPPHSPSSLCREGSLPRRRGSTASIVFFPRLETALPSRFESLSSTSSPDRPTGADGSMVADLRPPDGIRRRRAGGDRRPSS